MTTNQQRNVFTLFPFHFRRFHDHFFLFFNSFRCSATFVFLRIRVTEKASPFRHQDQMLLVETGDCSALNQRQKAADTSQIQAFILILANVRDLDGFEEIRLWYL